ncbi:membrane protein [Rhodoligotrophos appendicifer]|uniref:YihY/virulence factor BrkB family protein n=1 Tax=Rhodoligotrophos appendicifer TaxID=987056 RepID=UPI001FE79F3B|nr:YihY/virulence factor BrkB family protein [Rhodoligotrophos appendicifer]
MTMEESAEIGPILEPGRGRDARSPQDMPLKGWKDVLIRVFWEIDNDRILAVAAGVTFYALLALFPALTALISLYGLIADPASVQQQINLMQMILPDGAITIISDQLAAITSREQTTLGLSFFFGLAIALWSANAGMKALFDALNVVYGEKEKRSILMLNGVSLLFTVGALVLGIVTITGVVAIPIVLQFVGLGSRSEIILSLIRWPILAVIFIGAISVIYRYGPSRSRAKWRWVTGGAVLAAGLWLGVSALFSWYVASFGSYNETYGSLGAAIGFLTWIWISTIIVLVCAELNSELEHQTAVDSTTGAPLPMGERGARMADTIGPSQ